MATRGHTCAKGLRTDSSSPVHAAVNMYSLHAEYWNAVSCRIFAASLSHPRSSQFENEEKRPRHQVPDSPTKQHLLMSCPVDKNTLTFRQTSYLCRRSSLVSELLH